MPLNSYGLFYPIADQANDVPADIKQAVDSVGPFTNMRFANAAARDALLTAPIEGMCCWLNDANALSVYDGTVWRNYAGAETAYVPVWTATTTNPVIGTGGSAVGGYVMLSATRCSFWLKVTKGSTGTVGSGSYLFSLPFPAAAASDRETFTGVVKSGSSRFFCFRYLNTNTTLAMVRASTEAVVTAAAPLVPGNGDSYEINGVYDIA